MVRFRDQRGDVDRDDRLDGHECEMHDKGRDEEPENQAAIRQCMPGLPE